MHEVLNVEHGLTEEPVTTLGLNLQEAALDGAYAGGADVAVFGGEIGRIVAHQLAHGAQVFHVQQQQAVVVRNLENQLQHPRLSLVQVEHARQQQRPQIAHRGPHGMPLVTKNVPQRGGRRCKFRRGNPSFDQKFGQFWSQGACLRDASEVTLDIRHKYRHTETGKTLGHGLQGNRLASPGGAGDESVPVGLVGSQEALGIAVLRNQDRIGHEVPKKYN